MVKPSSIALSGVRVAGKDKRKAGCIKTEYKCKATTVFVQETLIKHI